jgi:peptide/nickel transport system permease protein
MQTYIIRRIFQGILVLFFAALTIYTILIVSPGGPADQIRDYQMGAGRFKAISPEYVAYVYQEYNLDKPWPLNFAAWLFDPRKTSRLDADTGQEVQRGVNINVFGMNIRGSGILTMDMGDSLKLAPGKTVTDLIGDRIVNTLILTASSLFLSILIAFPIGIISAIKQYSRLDYTVTTFSFLGLSMPTFWLGLMLIILLSNLASTLHNTNGWTWLPYFPPGEVTDVGKETDIANRLYHLVLPLMVLSFVNIAAFSRYVRSSMLEVLRQDYVRTAWAKGLSQRTVILKHALRNALIPLITIITLSLPILVTGAIITETVFAYAGIGKLYFDAISTFDIPVSMGLLLVSTTAIILSNILADVLYAVADPRIRYS